MSESVKSFLFGSELRDQGAACFEGDTCVAPAAQAPSFVREDELEMYPAGVRWIHAHARSSQPSANTYGYLRKQGIASIERIQFYFEHGMYAQVLSECNALFYAAGGCDDKAPAPPVYNSRLHDASNYKDFFDYYGLEGGYAVFCREEPYYWISELGDPMEWTLHTRAESHDGKVYCVMNDRFGQRVWQRINEKNPH